MLCHLETSADLRCHFPALEKAGGKWRWSHDWRGEEALLATRSAAALSFLEESSHSRLLQRQEGVPLLKEPRRSCSGYKLRARMLSFTRAFVRWGPGKAGKASVEKRPNEAALVCLAVPSMDL